MNGKERNRTLAGFVLALTTLLTLSIYNNTYAGNRIDRVNGDNDIRATDTRYCDVRGTDVRNLYVNDNERNAGVRDNERRNADARANDQRNADMRDNEQRNAEARDNDQRNTDARDNEQRNADVCNTDRPDSNPRDCNFRDAKGCASGDLRQVNLRDGNLYADDPCVDNTCQRHA